MATHFQLKVLSLPKPGTDFVREKLSAVQPGVAIENANNCKVPSAFAVIM